jgi:hypothetical protein
MAGTIGTFTVTTTGYPTSSLSESGALPAGVTFVDNGNGTATLSGTPTAGTGGLYSLTLTASNGALPNATQTFSLAVDQPPGFSSSSNVTFISGVANTFTIRTTGYPLPAISETGALPAGVTLVDNGNGTATLSGTPSATGTFALTLNSSNGLSPNGSQSLTLTVVSNGAYWTGGGNGTSWSDPNNWAGDLLPTQSENAVVPAGFGTIQVTSGTFAAYSLNSNSPIQIDAGGLLNLTGPSVIDGSLNIQSGGSLNVMNGSLAINYGVGNASPLTTVQGYLSSGAIFSSVVNANPGTTALGYADGSYDSNTAAQPGQVLIKYTLAGDANLDGQVNFADLLVVAQNFNQNNLDWAQGNFAFYTMGTDYFADLLEVAQNFNHVLSPAAASAEATGLSTIPLAQTAAVANTGAQPVATAAVRADAAGAAAVNDPVDDVLKPDSSPRSILGHRSRRWN